MLPSTDAEPAARYFPNLTGLRGIAAAWVVVFHVWHFSGAPPLRFDVGSVAIDLTPLASCGWFGVDLFFVLSGFLLGLPFLAAASGMRRWPALVPFWMRRARRVLPAYYLQLVLIVAILWLWRGTPPLAPAQWLAYLSMEFLLYAPTRDLLNPVWWSLPAEWHFYLILPLLGLLFARARWWLVLALALTWVVTFRLLCVESISTGTDRDVYWYTTIMHLPARIDQFLLGMVAAWWHLRGGLRAARIRRWLLLSGSLLLAVLLFEMGRRGDVLAQVAMPWMLWHYSLVGCAFALIVYAAAGEGAVALRLFGGPVLGFLGAISYSLYLWHVPVLRALVEIDFLQRIGWTGMLAHTLLPLPPIVIVAWASWRWIERPWFGSARAGVADRQPAEFAGAQ
ncbi:MAG: acyltransferase [Tahibacter sp.]